MNIVNGYFKNSRIQLYIGIILLRLTLDILYIFIINKNYDYSGFLLNFLVYKYVLSWIVMLAIMPFIVNLYNNASVSSTIILLFNLIYFIPGCTLYSLLGLPDSYFLFYVFYWIILMFWQYKIPYIHFKLPSEWLANRVFGSIVIAVICGAITISGTYNDFQLNLGLSNVNELRMQQRAMGLPGFVGYFQPMASVFIPFVLVYFLSKKKYFISFITIIIQILLFSFGGEKTTLFMIPVSILGFYFYRERRIIWFSWGLAILNIIALLEFFWRNSYLITAYLQRRTMFVTNLLAFRYYDYFSSHTPDYWFQSIMRRFGFVSQYHMTVQRLIGFKYTGDITTNANTGMVGDAFCNFTWLGLIVFPILIICALRLMDACAHRIDRRILIPVVIQYALTFTNGAFFSVMLTNGFLFMCIVLYFVPRKGQIFCEKGKYAKAM